MQRVPEVAQQAFGRQKPADSQSLSSTQKSFMILAFFGFLLFAAASHPWEGLPQGVPIGSVQGHYTSPKF